MSTTPSESWEALVSWEDELFDPIFQGDTSFTGASNCHSSFTSDYHVPESVTSDQQYAPSAPASIADGSFSHDYTLSGPPSVIDGPSSAGQAFSWLSASPSFSTHATSPFVERTAHLQLGVSSPCEDLASPLFPSLQGSFNDTNQNQPFPSASFNSSDSFQAGSAQIFNPFLATSPQAFSSRDVTASQAFANVGGWADQPQIVEPSPELDHERAIPIPSPLSYSNTFPLTQGSQEPPPEYGRARAITIPQPNQRGTSYNQAQYASRRALQVPPPLPPRPGARRNSFAKGVSTSEPRKGRNSLTTPSPTSSSFGWVSYQPNQQGNRLVPSGTEGNRGRRQRGRTKALTQEQRKNAALMRVIGVCSNCKRRKEKCDVGIPCKSCLEHYKGDLIHNPCRNQLLSDLSSAFLSDRLGWHPTARPLDSFIAPGRYREATGLTYPIPLNLGFGPVLHLPVHAIEIYDSNAEYHKHVIYSWPPGSAAGDIHTHAVLPAILTQEALDSLPDTLENHLSLLVEKHFRSFPLYTSPLRILRQVYIFYRMLPTNTEHWRLLHQALKLLVLVHIGGDLTISAPSSDPNLAQLVRTSMTLNLSAEEEDIPTPCFIRSQLGSTMPAIAVKLMKDVLSGLEQLLLNRECGDWPIALALLIVVLMIIESIQYHAAKLPYHNIYDHSTTTPPNLATSPKTEEHERKVDEQGIKSLFAFYSACFSGCHARLRPDWEGEAGSADPGAGQKDQAGGLSCEDKFVESVREEIKKASAVGYLGGKANGEREEGDMGFFFDRLVARLLVLKA
ncbi:hypothetical protein BCR34DRAFT_484517 [Clohesyomyces aquaticus]|uniref:Zn(2)-C6 fungal-type domain-containing protein n=1 Tax=Clohesyomyces aquaticus TaxID=1231657 RepID=A0A1Y1ZLV4_9PLEO|nr:hypothetical protein BCR34DRAFT_484517 [Clohesyomyces aquaticus]